MSASSPDRADNSVRDRVRRDLRRDQDQTIWLRVVEHSDQAQLVTDGCDAAAAVDQQADRVALARALRDRSGGDLLGTIKGGLADSPFLH